MACETGNNEVEDIEDLVKGNDPEMQRIGQSEVVPKIKEPRGKPKERPEGSNIPGIQTIYIKTWGCAHNTSDGGTFETYFMVSNRILDIFATTVVFTFDPCLTSHSLGILSDCFRIYGRPTCSLWVYYHK
jgi:hypothetical protein